MPTLFNLNSHAFAHRGLWDDAIPENSLAAFRAAGQNGFAAECDVHLSADGVPMVFHDFDLLRMTGHPAPLASLSARELAQFRLKGTDEPIPTLAECLSALGGQPMLIELKTAGDKTDRESLAEATLAVLRDYAVPFAIMSFDLTLLTLLREKSDALMLGLLLMPDITPDMETLRAQTRQARVDYLAPQIIRLAETAPIADALNLPLASWTIRHEELLAVAKAHKAAPIFENVKSDLVRQAVTT